MIHRLLHGVLAVALLLAGILLILNGVPDEMTRAQLWGYHILAVVTCLWGALRAGQEALKP